MGLNTKRIENRVFFEKIDDMRRDYLFWCQPNQVIPADGWAPDTSILDAPIQLDFIKPRTSTALTGRPTRGIIRRGGLR
jgi:hypothetical protein